MSTPPTYYPVTSNFRFFLHLIPETRTGFQGAQWHEMSVILLRNCSSSEVWSCWQYKMFFWVMAFYCLLRLLSDCDTVVLKGALNCGLWIAVVRFCACNMGSQNSNVPRGHGGWHNVVMILLLLLFITLEFLMAQVEKDMNQCLLKSCSYRLYHSSVWKKWRKFGRWLNSCSCFVCSQVFRS